MKLLHLHVDNFGCLCNFDYDFQDGLNVIFRDNGSGKTTMAYFIRTMLYGFAENNVGLKERRRFRPWQGGDFGGSIDFEAEGVRYTVSRQFGASSSEDWVQIVETETGLTAFDGCGNLGEAILGLNVNAFNALLFAVPGSVNSDSTADGLDSKLNALIEQLCSDAHYDDALARLNARKSELQGSGGIEALNSRLAELEEQKTGLGNELSEAAAAREHIIQLEAELEDIERTLTLNSTTEERATYERDRYESERRQYAGISSQMAQLRSESDSIEKELGGSVPDEKTVDYMRSEVRLLSELDNQLAENEVRRNELSAELQSIMERHGGSLPEGCSVDELKSVYADAQSRGYNGEAVADAYVRLDNAVAEDPDYIEKAEAVIAEGIQLEEMRQKLANVNAELEARAAQSEQLRREYAESGAEKERLESILAGMQQYSPENAMPYAEQLRKLKEEAADATARRDSLVALIAEEQNRIRRLNSRYEELNSSLEKVSEAVASDARYDSERVTAAIADLEEIKLSTDITAAGAAALSGFGPTPEQQAFLEENDGELPDAVDAGEIRSIIRTNAAYREDLAALNEMLSSKRAYADGLSASVEELQPVTQQESEYAELPKGRDFSAVISVGIALTIAGAALAFFLRPYLGAIAVPGIALIIIGAIGKKRYNRAIEAYEHYITKSEEAWGAQSAADSMNNQLAAVLDEINILEEQYSSEQQYVDDNDKVIREWFERWAPGTDDYSEDAVYAVVKKAEELRKIRELAYTSVELQEKIEDNSEALNAKRLAVNDAYPEISGRSITEALAILRTGAEQYAANVSTQQKIRNEIEAIQAEAGVSAEELASGNSAALIQLNRELAEAEEVVGAAADGFSELAVIFPELNGLSYDGAISDLTQKIEQYSTSYELLGNLSETHRALETAGSATPDLAEVTAERSQLADSISSLEARLATVLEPLGMSADLSEEALRKASYYMDAYRAMHKLYSLLDAVCGSDAALSPVERINELNEHIIRAEVIRGITAHCNEEYEELTARRRVSFDKLEQFVSEYGHFEAEGNKTELIFEKADTYRAYCVQLQLLENQLSGLGEVAARDDDYYSVILSRLADERLAAEGKRIQLQNELSAQSAAAEAYAALSESYPALERELQRTYAELGRITDAVGILDRTAELIVTAKSALPARYMESMSYELDRLVSEYVGTSPLHVGVAPDFSPVLYAGDEERSIESYSAGFGELVSFCLRIALVNTLFAGDKPFFVLDDPFVNLDSAELERAAELVRSISGCSQVVYFICNRSRAL